MEETTVISLGGSLVVPEEIDINFLQDFKKLILKQSDKGNKFVIIIGGGKICRKYQNAAKLLSSPTDEDLDMLGIKALNLNAELVRILFEKEKNVKIFGAEKPGSSTDLGAVMLAKENGAKRVINLSNIDYVYDSDPKKNKNAMQIKEISWTQYRALIPKEWNPGLNSPFDPVASKIAQEENLEVDILNGRNMLNLEKCLNGEEFIGTKIKN